MSTSTDSPRQLVIFSLGNEEYALPITRVQEIIRFTEPRNVASHTAWIRGVINLRGKIVPVCDLAQRLGLPTERVETVAAHRRGPALAPFAQAYDDVAELDSGLGLGRRLRLDELGGAVQRRVADQIAVAELFRGPPLCAETPPGRSEPLSRPPR